jgi:hypothetical protein
MTKASPYFGDILTTLYQHREVKVNENKKTFWKLDSLSEIIVIIPPIFCHTQAQVCQPEVRP